MVFPIKKQKEFFDSANIAESYSGVVLPLTCSFAKMLYEQVYKDLLVMSGVSRKKIENHSYIFKNLLGFFYGRMYYNMNNWYHLAQFVPGYSRNKMNFELMITSNIKQDINRVTKPSVFLYFFYPFIVILKVIFFDISSRRFKSKVRNYLHETRIKNIEKLDYLGLINLFENLNGNLLRRWYVALENDFFVMTYLGILKKVLSSELLQKAITFPSKATEQVYLISKLSKKIAMIPELWGAVELGDEEKFNIELMRNQSIFNELNYYLEEFGGRFASELKLESVGFDDDQQKLFEILKAYKNYEFKSEIVNLEFNFSFLKTIWIKFLIGKFRKYASRREEFRLLRSNTFSLARRIFKSIGKLLYKSKMIDKIEDVFYLELEEVLNSGAENNKNLKFLVKQRKEHYNSFYKISLPSHFALDEKELPNFTNLEIINDCIIKGHPASSGIVKGRVRVFKEFYIPEKQDFDILVTYHTDPGWTSLIALSKGIVVEHGGALSHASIVARELGIPAVIGVKDIVNSLVDGQLIEIDGSTGIIKIL